MNNRFQQKTEQHLRQRKEKYLSSLFSSTINSMKFNHTNMGPKIIKSDVNPFNVKLLT